MLECRYRNTQLQTQYISPSKGKRDLCIGKRDLYKGKRECIHSATNPIYLSLPVTPSLPFYTHTHTHGPAELAQKVTALLQ